MNWLDPSRRLKTFEYNASNSNEDSALIRAKSAEALVVHIHGPSKGFASHFDQYQWRELLLDSSRFCIIRDPIAKFESDFRYAVQTKSPHQLPHAHRFQLQSRIPFKPSVTDYFSQPEVCRINIDEWVQLIYDQYLLSLSAVSDEPFSFVRSRFDRFAAEFGQVQSDYFDAGIMSNMNTQLKQWFEAAPEAQFSSIIDNLGPDFIFKPRLESCLDMLFPTELLDDLFAMHVICSDWFKDITFFRGQLLEISHYPSILSQLSSLRSNETNAALKNSHQLSANSRMQFYQMAQKSYLAWNSSIVKSANMLSNFLSG